MSLADFELFFDLPWEEGVIWDLASPPPGGFPSFATVRVFFTVGVAIVVELVFFAGESVFATFVFAGVLAVEALVFTGVLTLVFAGVLAVETLVFTGVLTLVFAGVLAVEALVFTGVRAFCSGCVSVAES